MPDDAAKPPDAPPPTGADLPPPIHATPTDMPASDQEITWWRPTWRESARMLGYRWIFLIPAILLLATIVAAVFVPRVRAVGWVIVMKFGTWLVAIAVSLGAYGVRQASRARKNPFCIHCGYDLTSLPDNYRCPECGRPYTWKVIDEYRRDPAWFISRWNASKKLPPPASGFKAGATPRRDRARDGTE